MVEMLCPYVNKPLKGKVKESSLEMELPKLLDNSPLEYETLLISADFGGGRLVAQRVLLQVQHRRGAQCFCISKTSFKVGLGER